MILSLRSVGTARVPIWYADRSTFAVLREGSLPVPLPPPVSSREPREARSERRTYPGFQRGLLKPTEPRRQAQRRISVSERLSSLSDRTSSKSVRSDFSSPFQCPDFQPHQNVAPRVNRLEGEQSRNTREAQPVGAPAEWRVAMAVSEPGRRRKALMTKGLRPHSLAACRAAPGRMRRTT